MAKEQPVKSPSGELPETKSISGNMSGPTMEPPDEMNTSTAASDTATPMDNISKAGIVRAAELTTGGITAWQNSKTVNALWTINQDKNSWAGIAGTGWKKLSNVSASGNVALTVLMAHARMKNSSVNYRDEADGMIHEAYVW